MLKKAVFFIFLFFSMTLSGYAMSIFGAKTVWLSSPMKGVITFEGKIAAGAKVTRTISWKKEHTDTATTDEKGAFEFPEVTATQNNTDLSQFSAKQVLLVEYEGEQHKIWHMGKIDNALHGELGKEILLECELTNQLEAVEVPAGLLATNCKIK